MSQYSGKESNYGDELELKGYPPSITEEKAIEIARKKPFFRREKGVIDSTALLYKPFSLYHYKAIIRHKKHKDRPPEEVEIYIAVDMITGLGFETETIKPVTTIKVKKSSVINPLISEDKAFNEAKRLILKFKAKISRYGLEVIEESLTKLGILYKPIWIIKFINQGKEKYVGVDALKGTRV